jgi:hypothetical protein
MRNGVLTLPASLPCEDARGMGTSSVIEQARELLHGAIDTHLHTAPDVVPRSVGDVEAAEQARAAGMRAIVIKSHHTATGDRAQIAQAAVGDGIAVLGGVALDDGVGGLNPAAVEISARLGGTVAWMPTTSAATFVRWSAQHPADHPFGETPHGIEVLDAAGNPLPALFAVLEAIAEHRQILATGHLNAAEIAVLIREARRVGVERIVVTHPEHPYIGLTHAAQRDLAADGIVFERCYLAYPSQVGTAGPVAESIRAVGASSTVLATDFGQARNPPPVEGYEAFLRDLLELGIPAGDLRLASATNPAALLGL